MITSQDSLNSSILSTVELILQSISVYLLSLVHEHIFLILQSVHVCFLSLAAEHFSPNGEPSHPLFVEHALLCDFFQP